MAQTWNDPAHPWQSTLHPWKDQSMPWNNTLLPWKQDGEASPPSGTTGEPIGLLLALTKAA